MTANFDPDTFDVVVIGGGAIGENVADRAVKGGLTAALVEHELVGGECSYWACMPSKALLRPGHALAAARRLPGVPVGDHLDAAKVLARRTYFTSNWDDAGQVQWAEGAGITVIRGSARLDGERRVVVGDRTLIARQAVAVCTGSVPVIPPLEGIADTRVWTSRDATSAKEVPGRLIVLGGGVVGVELAQAWRRLGSEVDLVITGELPLPRLEPIAGELVAEGLREDGVRLHTGSKAVRVSRTGGEIELGLADGAVLKADELLVATGRRPATEHVGVETVGLKPGDTLHVDDSGLVSGVDGQWLYAAGDVTGRAPLTHQGKYDARVVGDVIAARAKGPVETPPWSQYAATADHAAVPQVVFTDPEVAAVGLTADQAARAGIETRVVDLDIAVAGSSVHADGYRGKARMVVDERRKVLVGVTFVGQDVAELLHSATVAIVGEVPLHRLWHAVPSYPTISEVWLRLLEAYGL
ncbi:dihydrolipoyl dehydrogenase family protein [Kutzneria kofuensis]|uniref:Dihydrolipoamide dehydrogenase n=1 Tax=Kutzneria kofuensis TaxID=103725 RepID=A0A7W9KDE4_9PSEU|nr:NAD(P)/FAD-dependent oxidoreductase [Kutzneria kofuensis]MBB5890549.1 dihydrolipoamide dehydrogenase [Kutzneria kofuensis]